MINSMSGIDYLEDLLDRAIENSDGPVECAYFDRYDRGMKPINHNICDGCPVWNEFKGLSCSKAMAKSLVLEMRAIQSADEAKGKVPISDAVHNPSHYERGGMRCDEALGAMLSPEQQVGYWYGCVMKYVWRWPSKYEDKDHQIEDIDKAIECLTRLKALVLAAALEESEDK